ncbi:MAG: M48 family metalloprotease [Notoacmeibacter sp.]|nr:M48 family metalloprotease [Notoacmeibacter sp.]
MIVPACGHNLHQSVTVQCLHGKCACVYVRPCGRAVTDLPKVGQLEPVNPNRDIRPSGQRRLRRLAAFVLPLALAACQIPGSALDDPSIKPSDTPVTVDTVKANEAMQRIGEAQNPKILKTYGGAYSDQKLERMVAGVVGRLSEVSGKSGTVYRIVILDSPSINAFALPGGYLYVTRGLLALANDSAELATVLSHEIGHVTASHGLLRQRLEQDEVISQKVADEILANDPDARAALIRGKLKLAQFSRNQELEADLIGITQAAEAGYDPFAAARFLRSMEAYTQFRSVSGANDPAMDFLASHPAGERRIELAQRHARNFSKPGERLTDRDRYLDGIDGLLYGDKPQEGFVRGREFLHPLLGIGFTVPQGFVIDNSKAAVTAAGPGDVAIRFDAVALDPKTPLETYVASGWVSGLDAASITPSTVNGQPAVIARATADGWQFDITVIRIGGQAYRLLTAAPLSSAALQPTAQSVRNSFRVLSASERASLKPLRVRVVTAKPGDTIATLAAQMVGTERKLDLFRVLNAMSPGATVSAGERVKIITDR